MVGPWRQAVVDALLVATVGLTFAGHHLQAVVVDRPLRRLAGGLRSATVQDSVAAGDGNDAWTTSAGREQMPARAATHRPCVVTFLALLRHGFASASSTECIPYWAMVHRGLLNRLVVAEEAA